MERHVNVPYWSPSAPLSLAASLRRSETSTENLCQEPLESFFSRLSVSSPVGLPPYPGSGDDLFPVSLGNIHLDDLPLPDYPLPSFPELSQNLRYSVPPSFQDHLHCAPVPDTDSWDALNHFSCLAPGLNEQPLAMSRSGFPLPSSRGFPRRESNHGSLDGMVSKRQDLLRPSAHNRRPHWLQEPFNYLSVRDLRGKILTLAKDQYGCRFLQDKMKSVTEEEIEMVFSELIDHAAELMIDQFGNYVVQRLVEVCSEEQRTQILLRLTQHDFQLVEICLNIYGTRAVQTLLNHINTPHQIKIFMAAIIPGAVALCKDGNGQHVIVHCSKHFSAEDNKYLLNEIAVNCFGIATDKSGCCVLQQCVDNAQGESRDHLVAEIIANALLLAEDPYGNYVVQHMLEFNIPQITANLLAQLEGSYTALSCNKYGSNVVEKCLSLTREDQSMQIIRELLNSRDAAMLLVHPFGNYVIQSALTASIHQGPVHDALLNLIQMNIRMMRSNIYGKKVLDWFAKKKAQYMSTCTRMREAF